MSAEQEALSDELRRELFRFAGTPCGCGVLIADKTPGVPPSYTLEIAFCAMHKSAPARLAAQGDAEPALERAENALMLARATMEAVFKDQNNRAGLVASAACREIRETVKDVRSALQAIREGKHDAT